MLKVYLISLLNLILTITSINGDCKLYLKNEVPLVVKNFGTRKIIIREKTETSHQLAIGENLLLYCATNLILRTDYTNYITEEQGIKSIELACITSSQIRFKNLNEDVTSNGSFGNSGTTYISCSQRSQQHLYESRKALQNCQYMSYAIGTSIPHLKDVITAGICYDFDTLNFKFINYLAHRPQYEFVVNPLNTITDIDSVTLDKKLSKLSQFFRFMSSDTFNSLLGQKKTQLPLLNSFIFDFDSIMQESALKSAYKEYSDLLNIIWWHNLRIGNWKLFLETLEERAKRINYNMYLGAAGNLSIPTTGCNRTEAFTLQGNDVSVQAPKYIWAYLQSLQANVSEEFVVIGINSPYVQAVSDELFCKDMCNEISWLQNTLFGRLRLMPTMGVVFCCQPEEVAAKFENFPYEVKKVDNGLVMLPNYMPPGEKPNAHESAPTDQPLMD